MTKSELATRCVGLLRLSEDANKSARTSAESMLYDGLRNMLAAHTDEEVKQKTQEILDAVFVDDIFADQELVAHALLVKFNTKQQLQELVRFYESPLGKHVRELSKKMQSGLTEVSVSIQETLQVRMSEEVGKIIRGAVENPPN